MSSRSATVLVIFIVAVFAFCLASVFASMTGQISILPEESESGGILDNLSAITDDDGANANSYGYQDYNDYSTDESSDDSSNVETTTDSSSSSSQVETTSDSSSSQQSSSGSQVETTTDSSSSQQSSSGSQVETTTG